MVEVKNETIRTRCGAADLRRRLIVSTSRRESADIIAALLQNLDLDLSAQKFPILRCRDDYWKLYDEVTRRQTLRPDTAAFFLARYTRFTGGSRPADCR